MKDLIEKVRALKFGRAEGTTERVYNKAIDNVLEILESQPPTDWLTGNKKLLEDLPQGTLILVDYHYEKLETPKYPIVYKKKFWENDIDKPLFVDESDRFRYPFEIAKAEFFRYHILPPLPTEPK